MDRERLEQELRNHFSMEVKEAEPSRDWWHNAVTRIGVRRQNQRWFGLVPKTRLAWVLVPVLVLLLGGTVYGATSIIQGLFHKWATGVETAGLAQELNLSQTIDGVTVRLERAYADSNVILVGFTVSGSKEKYYTQEEKLSTADGHNLPVIDRDVEVSGWQRIMGSWQSSEHTAVLTAYDASSLKGNPAELNLRLEMGLADTVTGNTDTVMGPFVFDFTLPFHAEEVIDVKQTVEASGIPITLERVVISHWATQAIFSFSPPYDNTKSRPLMIASVQPASGDNVSLALGKIREDGTGQYSFEDLTGKPGEWTITITELVFPPDLKGQTPEVYPEPKRLAGPWVFKFGVH